MHARVKTESHRVSSEANKKCIDHLLSHQKVIMQRQLYYKSITSHRYSYTTLEDEGNTRVNHSDYQKENLLRQKHC